MPITPPGYADGGMKEGDAVNITAHIPMPDELTGKVILVVFGATVLSLFKLYGLVKAWLESAKAAVEMTRKLSQSATDLRASARRVSADRPAAAVALTVYLVLAEAAWLAYALAFVNVAVLAYSTPSQEVFQHQTAIAGFVPDAWLHWSQISSAYVLIALFLLARMIVKDRPEPGAYLFTWILALPALWVVPVCWSVFWDLMSAVFGQADGAKLANGLVLLAVVGLYFAVTYLALNAGQQLGNIWLRGYSAAGSSS
ncbi:hypothetical protein [Streptomyces aureus]|uniref:hypothetical protein n=1 Tax=Streptomyces aureus TaxID=193461 RepID=UPI003680B984